MKMKKVICLLLVLLMMLSGTVFAFAADETEDAMISEDGEISLRSGGSGRLTVPVYYQPQNSNQCGPTSCRMILACFGVNKSLSAIGDNNDPHYDSRFGGAKQCNWLDMQTAINNFYGLIVRGE